MYQILKKEIDCLIIYSWILTDSKVSLLLQSDGINCSYKVQTKALYKTKFKEMKGPVFDLQSMEEGKLHCIDHPQLKQSYFVQVHSQNFTFNNFDKGSIAQRQKYDLPPELDRYFMKRKFFFHRFSEGIELDHQSWFSVIPEDVSLYLKDRFKQSGYQRIFEPFCGVGGIAIHLCDSFQEYRVNDIDKKKIAMLKNNMQVYEKDLSYLQPYRQDFLQVKPFQTDMLIVCPPWGGIDISEYSHRDLDEIMTPKLSDILKHCLKFSSNIMLQMPKNTNIFNLIKVINKFDIFPVFSVEKIMTNGRNSQLFIYFGDQNFTQIERSCIHHEIYADLKLNEKKDRKSMKKRLREKPNQVMKEIFNSHVMKHRPKI